MFDIEKAREKGLDERTIAILEKNECEQYTREILRWTCI